MHQFPGIVSHSYVPLLRYAIAYSPDAILTEDDPCPYGWRGPDGGETGLWAKAFGGSSSFTDGPWQSSNYGMNFGTAAPVGIYAGILEIDESEAEVNPDAQSERAYALSIRCVKE